MVFVSEFVKYSFSDNLNKFVIVPVVPAMLKDYQLNKYYDLLIKDLDNIDLVHFGVVKNEMIKINELLLLHQKTKAILTKKVDNLLIALDTAEAKSKLHKQEIDNVTAIAAPYVGSFQVLITYG